MESSRKPTGTHKTCSSTKKKKKKMDKYGGIHLKIWTYYNSPSRMCWNISKRIANRACFNQTARGAADLGPVVQN